MFSLLIFYFPIASQFQKLLGCYLRLTLLFQNLDYSADRIVFEIGLRQSSSCLATIHLPYFLKTHVNPLFGSVPLATSNSFFLVSRENVKNLDFQRTQILKLFALFFQHLERASWIFCQLLLSPFFPSWLEVPFSFVPIVSALCAYCILFYQRLLRLDVSFL